MSNPVESKWKAVCDQVASYDDVDEIQFLALMERVVPQAFSDGFLLITADNSFLKSWIEKNFLAHIERALHDIYSIPFSIVVEVDEMQGSNDSTASASPIPQPTQSGSASYATTGDAQQNAPGMQHQSGAETRTVAAANVGSPSNAAAVDAANAVNAANMANVASAINSTATVNVASAAAAATPQAIKTPSGLAAVIPSNPEPLTEAPVEAGTSQPMIAQPGVTEQIASGSGTKAFKTLTFENFVRGDSNRMAYSMAVQVAEFPGRSILNPLFIYGKSGLGKTHLMRAIQNYINSTQPELVTVYEDTDNFVSGYVNATIDHTREKTSYQSFIRKYENADVLLVDDVQFLQNKEQTIDIIFQIFNKLISQGKQIVLSADRAPKNIGIDERYTSRFGQGGTIDIKPPEVETKLAIIRSFINEHRMAEGSGDIDVPESIQMYIAENSGSNIRELKSAVTHLVMHMNYLDNPDITLVEARNLLENHFSRGMGRNLTIEDIQKEVESFYKVKHSDLISNSRARDVVFPRQIAMYLCRQLLDDPLETIGNKFNRDHSTVMHSVSKIEKDILTNRNIQEELEVIKKNINEL